MGYWFLESSLRSGLQALPPPGPLWGSKPHSAAAYAAEGGLVRASFFASGEKSRGGLVGPLFSPLAKKVGEVRAGYIDIVNLIISTESGYHGPDASPT